MLYNIKSKSGSRVATIESPRLERSTFEAYARSGLFIQVCDTMPTVSHLDWKPSGYLVGAVIAIAMQVIAIAIYLI